MEETKTPPARTSFAGWSLVYVHSESQAVPHPTGQLIHIQMSRGYIGKRAGREDGILLLENAFAVTVTTVTDGASVDRRMDALPLELSGQLKTVRARAVSEFDLGEVRDAAEIGMYAKVEDAVSKMREDTKVDASPARVIPAASPLVSANGRPLVKP